MHDLPKVFRITVGALTAIIVFFALTALFQLRQIIQAGVPGLIAAVPYLWLIKFLIAALVGFFIFLWPQNDLSQIKARKVGDNQHGSATWMTDAEKHQTYRYVQKGHEKTPGIIIGRNGSQWMVDTSDQTVCLLAPPGGGKTKCVFIPTFFYNAYVNRHAGHGASIISVDVKKENFASCAPALIDAGYNVYYLDFRYPMHSYHYNLMVGVNAEIDLFKFSVSETDRAIHYARAEKYAKQVSNSIVKNIQGEGKDDASVFFNNTAAGLITGLTLLVSQYGEENERHIISVFKLVIELNGLVNEDTDNKNQRSKLGELLEHVDNDRIVNYVGASMSADVRTSMNIFSSALAKLTDFIDAELEQMICDHSPEINPADFIEKPTAIFLICPDEDSSRHFFASLFIRYFTTQLIEMAEESPNGRLSRDVLALWDEFGNMPPIKDVDSLFTAARSRGIRILFSLQSFAQLQKSYNRSLSDIIQDSSQILMFTYVSPTATDTAKKLSEILGKQTVMTGGVSHSHSSYRGGDHSSANLQMIGRPLLTPDEIMRIRFGDYIVIKSGTGNMRTKLPLYWAYLPKAKPYEAVISPPYKKVQYLTSDKIRKAAMRRNSPFKPGMFD